MNSDRIKEIQETTAYPESVSVKQALLQVWNECEQEQVKKLNIPDVVGRSEQLKADLYAFRDMYCQNIDISIIDEYVDGKGF